jgi:hypothetical protein
MFVTYKENVAALVDLAAAAQEKKFHSISNAVMAYLIEGFFVLTSSGEELPELRLGYASHYDRQDVSQIYYDLVTVGLEGDDFDPLVIPVPLADDTYVIGILKGTNAVPREETYIRPTSVGTAEMDKAQLWEELCLGLVFKDDLVRAVSRVIARDRREGLLKEIEAVYEPHRLPTAEELLQQTIAEQGGVR